MEAMGRKGCRRPDNGRTGRRERHAEDEIDATYLKAHRKASSLRVKKGAVGASSVARKAV